MSMKWVLVTSLIVISFNDVLAENILTKIRNLSNLSKFASLLERNQNGLHRAYLNRTVTVFAPTNLAIENFRSKYPRYEGNLDNIILNHMSNVAVELDTLPREARLTSLMAGNPPLWITRTRRGDIHVNSALILMPDLGATANDGSNQILHVIDEVLNPLLPVVLKDIQYFSDLTAGKLLEKSTLYNTGGYKIRKFAQRVDFNKKMSNYTSAGRHTFFIPIDAAFRNLNKELVDASVIKGHIIPNVVQFTRPLMLEHGRGYKTLAYDNNFRVYIAMKKEYGSRVTVTSENTKGNSVHNRGNVIANIVKANIPVHNGVVHFIDKPLVIVATSMHHSIMNQIGVKDAVFSEFARLMKDKGGQFWQSVSEAKYGTLFVPSNAAFKHARALASKYRNYTMTLGYILANPQLTKEIFGLHFIRENINLNEIINRRSYVKDNRFSLPSSYSRNRIWFDYNDNKDVLTVEGRGVNATVIIKDVSVTNGIIHVIDRILGIPYETVYQKIVTDPLISKTASLGRQEHFNLQFNNTNKFFTYIVPSNEAWEKIYKNSRSTYKKLFMGGFAYHGSQILERHTKIDTDKTGYTIEELVELSERNPRGEVDMLRGEFRFVGQGSGLDGAYTKYYVEWDGMTGEVVKPNVQCVNGYIHVIDTVMLKSRDVTVSSASQVSQQFFVSLLTTFVLFKLLK